MIRIPGLEIVRQIGSGGMSTVWMAKDAARGRTVAVKVLNREYAASEADVRQFREEERLLEEVKHPGIVQAYGFGNAGGCWYFVMEHVDGYSFADLLKRKQHVRESDCLLICESVASALSYAWNDHGIVHCDIKPENLMINTQGVIKLMDLGISHRYEFIEGNVEAPDLVLGTPAYISPEQVYGDVELDCRSDIYSLAASLFHLATGRVLFPNLDNEETMRAHCADHSQAPDPRAYRHELSEGFCQLLEAMLVKNRDARLASWQDVFDMCRDIESGATFAVRDPTGAPSSVRLLPAGLASPQN